jgi:hypothetical protein
MYGYLWLSEEYFQERDFEEAKWLMSLMQDFQDIQDTPFSSFSTASPAVEVKPEPEPPVEVKPAVDVKPAVEVPAVEVPEPEPEPEPEPVVVVKPQPEPVDVKPEPPVVYIPALIEEFESLKKVVASQGEMIDRLYAMEQTRAKLQQENPLIRRIAELETKVAQL